ncbi:MAG: glycoside hydrolase family 16 protein, partial [Litorilituus sp.]|nr:glycoside hydrolase family 16 protein [Litorilituus sp.]
GVSEDASSLLSNGVVQFDMKVVNAPNDASAAWMFKIESDNGDTAVELALTASQEGASPVVGQWQTYTFSLQELFDAGLDISAIDVLMVFPAWGAGDGAVYRLDNIKVTAP